MGCEGLYTCVEKNVVLVIVVKSRFFNCKLCYKLFLKWIQFIGLEFYGDSK